MEEGRQTSTRKQEGGGSGDGHGALKVPRGKKGRDRSAKWKCLRMLTTGKEILDGRSTRAQLRKCTRKYADDSRKKAGDYPRLQKVSSRTSHCTGMNGEKLKKTAGEDMLR